MKPAEHYFGWAISFLPFAFSKEESVTKVTKDSCYEFKSRKEKRIRINGVLVRAEANSFLTWFEGKVNGQDKEWSKREWENQRRGLSLVWGGREEERSPGMSNDEFIVVRGSSEKPRKITVSFLLFISFLSHLFLVFSWLTMAVHKMPILGPSLYFSPLIHITRHLQWYVWKARTWRSENTEQKRNNERK